MVIRDGNNYPIQPVDIRTDKVLVRAFGKFEMEYTARLILIFCKLHEDWVAFTAKDLAKRFPAEVKSPHFDLGLLIEGNFLAGFPDGSYRVTAEFVERCHKISQFPQGS